MGTRALLKSAETHISQSGHLHPTLARTFSTLSRQRNATQSRRPDRVQSAPPADQQLPVARRDSLCLGRAVTQPAAPLHPAHCYTTCRARVDGGCGIVMRAGNGGLGQLDCKGNNHPVGGCAPRAKGQGCPAAAVTPSTRPSSNYSRSLLTSLVNCLQAATQLELLLLLLLCLKVALRRILWKSAEEEREVQQDRFLLVLRAPSEIGPSPAQRVIASRGEGRGALDHTQDRLFCRPARNGLLGSWALGAFPSHLPPTPFLPPKTLQVYARS